MADHAGADGIGFDQRCLPDFNPRHISNAIKPARRHHANADAEAGSPLRGSHQRAEHRDAKQYAQHFCFAVFIDRCSLIFYRPGFCAPGSFALTGRMAGCRPDPKLNLLSKDAVGLKRRM